MADLKVVATAAVADSTDRISTAWPLLTGQHENVYQEFKAFVAANVEPFAEQWDRDQKIPQSALALLAQSGYLGCSLPRQYGGRGWDITTFGLLNEALGRGSSALTGVLTVQTMV